MPSTAPPPPGRMVSISLFSTLTATPTLGFAVCGGLCDAPELSLRRPNNPKRPCLGGDTGASACVLALLSASSLSACLFALSTFCNLFPRSCSSFCRLSSSAARSSSCLRRASSSSASRASCASRSRSASILAFSLSLFSASNFSLMRRWRSASSCRTCFASSRAVRGRTFSGGMGGASALAREVFGPCCSGTGGGRA